MNTSIGVAWIATVGLVAASTYGDGPVLIEGPANLTSNSVSYLMEGPTENTPSATFAQGAMSVHQVELSGTTNRLKGIRLTPTGYQLLDGTSAVADVFANSINASGAVAGTMNTFGKYSAVRWEPGSTVALPLGSLSTNMYQHDRAFSINRSGLIAGFSTPLPGSFNERPQPVVWLPGTAAPVALANPENLIGEASLIHDSGRIVGRVVLPGAEVSHRVVTWSSATGSMQQLGALEVDQGRETATAVDLNARGTIVGHASRYVALTEQSHAVRWDANQTAATELRPAQTLGGFLGSKATAINSAGTTVGVYSYSNEYNRPQSRAMRWDEGSVIGVELQRLPNAIPQANARANDVNELGYAVGMSTLATMGDRHAVLWGPDGSVTPLRDLISAEGWNFQEIYSISETGWISGISEFESAEYPYPYLRSFHILLPSAGTFGLGDANFDGTIDFADLVTLAANYNKPSNGSPNTADFDLNGITNFPDLVTLAGHYNQSPGQNLESLGRPFQEDWARAMAMVPEPTSVMLIVIGSGLALRRRW